MTRDLLLQFPDKKWVIDGGSLQIMDSSWIPEGAVITPNIHEFRSLFGLSKDIEIDWKLVEEKAASHRCVIVYKGPVSYVSDGKTTYEINGGNAGLTKGGTGDTLAGVTVGFLAKNPPLLSAAAASLVVKKTAETLYEKVGYNFNADDVAGNVFSTLKMLTDLS
jgi:NAD(P)H-hydrate epimerase